MKNLAQQYIKNTENRHRQQNKEREIMIQDEKEDLNKNDKFIQQDSFVRQKYKQNMFNNLKADWDVRQHKRQVRKSLTL